MPADAENISDNCGLFRRIAPIHIVPDKNLGRRRLSSGAFRDPRLSVDAECLLAAAGLDWSFSLRAHPNFFLVRLHAGFARSRGQVVEHTPLADNPYHAEVVGRKSGSVSDAFRDAAEWVRKPDDV